MSQADDAIALRGGVVDQNKASLYWKFFWRGLTYLVAGVLGIVFMLPFFLDALQRLQIGE